MLTYEQNVKAVLECIFAGYKDELIEDACRRICALSRSENPNTCGDAISRQSAIFLASDLKQDLPDDERIADMVMAHNEGILEYQTQLSLLPSVTPHQRTGRWIEVIDETDSLGNKTWHHECSICGSDKSGWGTYKHCPDCGTKMEVENG